MEHGADMPRIIGGRFGLSSKEFTPAMVRGIFDELNSDRPKNHFTVGIHDDVSHSNLDWDPAFRTDAGAGVTRCLFYGLGSDGTVSANKNSIKIIGETTDLHTQGYFVYDSKKAGAVTISHLRFGPQPIRSSYLIADNEAQFIACHQPVFLEHFDLLENAAEGGVFLLNTHQKADKVWATLTTTMQQRIIDKQLRFFVIDAYQVARQSGMARRINTIMQTCFFAISNIIPGEQAIEKIKQAVQTTYGRKGKRIVDRNFMAIDNALANLHQVSVADKVNAHSDIKYSVAETAPAFVRQVTAGIIAGKGDAIPVSLLPADGTWPLGTAAWEKRNLAPEIPV